MNRQIKTGSRRILQEKSANGVNGILIRSTENDEVKYLFRVYDGNGNFDDYKLRFEDLPVTISEDALASFYKDASGELYLDETPETMGWKILETNG